MGTYILGLDAGNTVIKAIIFDLSGRELALAACDGRSSMPKPGHVERDLDELWRKAVAVIGQCIDQAGIEPSEIVAIGCAGHGNGLYALDRDGAPLSASSRSTRALSASSTNGLDKMSATSPMSIVCKSHGQHRRRPCSPGSSAMRRSCSAASARCSCARILSSTG
jgi:hypothetical protein